MHFIINIFKSIFINFLKAPDILLFSHLDNVLMENSLLPYILLHCINSLLLEVAGIHDRAAAQGKEEGGILIISTPGLNFMPNYLKLKCLCHYQLYYI